MGYKMAGIVLTEAGVRKAEEVTANNPDNIQDINLSRFVNGKRGLNP
jgi:hypothetical protein